MWEHAVGGGRALLALRADWQAHLARAARDLGFQRARFHGLLDDDLGAEVAWRGEMRESFLNADRVVEALLERGVRPLVELSFMPSALASGTATVFRWRAHVSPPRDLAAWTGLVRRLVAHWIDRYGAGEMANWLFEVWNEPNLALFWSGSRDEYLALYRATARAIKEVDPDLRVGGPATAREGWIPGFLAFCEREDVPVDFVSTHHYATDDGGAGGTRDRLRERAARARQEAGTRPLFYTEWNFSADPFDPLRDEPFAAAFAVRAALQADAIVDGYAWWTFTDIFDEEIFPHRPFHGGFGLLTLHGVPKPTYRAFELLHALGDERLPVEGDHETVDAWIVRGRGSVTAIVTNHDLPGRPIASEAVRIVLSGTPAPRAVTIRRVDAGHAHAAEAWRAMGAPEYPSAPQVAELEEASRLVGESLPWRVESDAVVVECTLPPHAVAAITVKGR